MRQVRAGQLHGDREPLQRQGLTTFTQLASAPSDPPELFTYRLRLVLMPLPPAARRAIDRAAGNRTRGPVLLNSRGARMDRHAATRRLHQLAGNAGIQVTRGPP